MRAGWPLPRSCRQFIRAILPKIPGWLLGSVRPSAIRWRHLPKALPWFHGGGAKWAAFKVKAITAARAESRVCGSISDFETAAQRCRSVVPDGLPQDAMRLFDKESSSTAEAESGA